MGKSTCKLLIAILLLTSTGALVLVRLGQYPLWDDEATTALYAQSVWRTGDTHAMVDHNIVAFRSGAELRDLRNRYMPPLGYYVAAPFVGILGNSAFAARLPFAVCGILTVALMVCWLWRDRADGLTWVLTTLGVVGNVSLVLFSRQCRYYALSMLLSAILAYLYLHHTGRRRYALAMGAVSVCLLASNYLNYAALFACALVDYVLWGRKTYRLQRVDWLLLCAPQLILGSWLLWVWNPLIARRIWGHEPASWLSHKATLVWWNLRDLNGCEFGVGVLILIAPMRWLVRAPLALLIYIVVAALASPQQVSATSVATVRYLVPVIPLCIFIGVAAIRSVTARSAWLAVPLALVAFQSNLLHGGPHSGWGRSTVFDDVVKADRLRCTMVDHVLELVSPLPSSYAAVIDWIRQNVGLKQSIWVVPNYATYPLMAHAPHALYAWQLQWPPEAQFKQLDPIHFFGQAPVQYVIVFGPAVSHLQPKLLATGYKRIALIDRYWADLTRPELFYHAFEQITEFDRSDQAIYIYQRTSTQLAGAHWR
jgi:hypothetical protein